MAAVLVIGSALVSSPANAAGSSASRDGVHIHFNASPEPIKKCGKVLLAGEVWLEGIDDQSVAWVNFYFKKDGSSKYVFKSSDLSVAYNGRYSKRVKQCSSGRWKATVNFGDYAGPGATDHVKVRR